MCKNIFLSLLLLYFIIDDVTSRLFLSHFTEVKQENDTLSVICREEETGAAVKWKTQKGRELGQKTHPISRITTYGAQLIFKKIKKSDAGIYKCKSKNEEVQFELNVQGNPETSIENPTGGSITYDVTNVAEPRIYKHAGVESIPSHTVTSSFTTSSTRFEEQIEFRDTPRIQQTDEGNPEFLLRCEATGGKVNWLIDGEAPTEDRYEVVNDGLVIFNVTKADAKNYTCNAYNTQLGIMKDRIIQLLVLHRPRFPNTAGHELYIKEEIVYSYPGSELDLECEVEAEPPPNFVWYGKDKKRKIAQINNDISPYKSVMKLKMTENEFGEYKCEASNPKGKLEIRYKILTGSRPDPPTSVTLIEAESDALNLKIEGPELMEEPEEPTNDIMQPIGYLVKYKEKYSNESSWMEQNFPVSEDKVYSLRELQHDTPYEVRAATRNRAGLSEYTNMTTFQTANSAYRNTISMNPLFYVVTIFLMFNTIHSLFDKNIH